MRSAHIFNLDNLLINLDQKVWIIDILDPDTPIFKIDRSEFNMIKGGLYRKYNIRLKFQDRYYYISQNLLDTINENIKNYSKIEELTFSFREFTDKDIIKNIKADYDLVPIMPLKNRNDVDIYFITTKGIEKKYGQKYNELINKLTDEGIIVKKVFYLNQTYFANDKDSNIKKLCYVILSLYTGYNIIKDKFDTEKEYVNYESINYYDSNFVINNRIEREINIFMNSLLVRDKRGTLLTEVDLNTKFNIIKYTSNILNPFISKRVMIHIDKLIKKFESFINGI